MKRKLLFAIAALLCSVSMWADVVPTASTPSAGNTYYLYNPATQKFLFVSNDNIPYVQLEGMAWDLLESDKSGYIKIRQKNVDTGYFWGKYWAIVAGSYADYNNETYFQINEVSAGSTYKLHPFSWDGTSTAYVYINAETANGWRVACNSQEQAGLDEKYTIWQFVTEADYATYMSQKYGTDVSSRVTNTTFETNVSGWTATGGFQNSQKANNQKGAFDGYFWENWNKDTGKVNKMYQDVSLLSNGVYTLRMAAFVNNLGSSNQYVFANSDKTYLATTVPTFYEVQTLVKNKTLSIGLEQTGTTANWMGIDNVRLFYLGNNVEYYSPATFNSNNSATKDTWYEFSVGSAGWYRINSSDAAKLYYTQDDSDDADATASKEFTAGGYTFMNLSAGSFYFKSDATSTIKIEAVGSGVLVNGDVVTEVFITNPSFEAATADKQAPEGWTRSKNSFLARTLTKLGDKKVGTYIAGASGYNVTEDMYQTFSGLEEGNYVLSVNAYARNIDGNAKFYVGTDEIVLPNGYTPDTYTIAINESANSKNFGIKGKGVKDNCDLFFDNFTLTYYSTLPDVSITSLTAEPMAGDVRAALDAANTAYTGSKTVANYNALQTAIVNAKASIAAFAANTGADADWTGVIVNPTFSGTYTNGASGTTQGWTITGTSGNRQFNAGAAESWSNNNVVFSQVIKNLPAGTYKLTAQVDNCHEDANVALYATCNETTYSTVAPYRACTTNYATTSSDLAADESLCLTTLYLKVEAGKDLTIGVKDESTSGGWMIFDNFKLTYDPTLPESVTAVVGKMNSSVESTQTSAVNTYNTTNNIDNLVAAQAAIYAATKSKVVYNEITTIKSNYDTKAAALDATGQAAYAAGTSATKYTNGTYVTASEAETAYHDDYIAAVKAQDTDNAVYTDVLVNPSFESFGANNVPTGWTLNVGGGYQSNRSDEKKKEGRLVEGGGDYYFAFWTNNPTSSEVYQNINLPAGSYKLSVYVCTAAGTTLTLKAGTETTTVEAANGDAFKMEVSFSLASATDVKVSIGTTTGEAWYNMDECQLILTASYYANAADYAALNSAISTATTTYYNHLGFETGDYAPYNNIAALTTLAAANDIDQEASNTKASVQTATTNLTGATWFANVESVNAIYNWDMNIADGNNPKGWSRQDNGWGQQVTPSGDYNFDITSNKTAWYYNNWDAPKSSYYGNTGLYTMPLKANTMYEFKVKYCSQGTGDGGGVVSSYKATVQKGEETAVLDEFELGENKTQTFVEKKVYFMTTSAGDYVLTLTNIGNIFFTDVSITKVADQKLTLPSATPYAAGTYPAVTIDRTFSADNWNTLCVPFAFNKSAFAQVKELSGITVTGDHISMTLSDASTIVAGKPYLVKASSNGASLTATDVEMPGASVQGSSATADGYTVNYVGTYDGVSLTSANSNAFVVSNNALYNVDSDVTVGAYRAYFTVSSGIGGVKALSFNFNGETGINAIDNGQFTTDNAPIFNLAGQRVQKAQKGIYIVNGKKVLVK